MRFKRKHKDATKTFKIHNDCRPTLIKLAEFLHMLYFGTDAIQANNYILYFHQYTRYNYYILYLCWNKEEKLFRLTFYTNCKLNIANHLQSHCDKLRIAKSPFYVPSGTLWPWNTFICEFIDIHCNGAICQGGRDDCGSAFAIRLKHFNIQTVDFYIFSIFPAWLDEDQSITYLIFVM